jgi:hypothetical protein
MRRSLSPALPFRASNASDKVWSRATRTGLSATQSSVCSSDGVAGSLRADDKTPEPALPAPLLELHSSCFLCDLELSAEDIAGSHSSLAPSSHRATYEFEEDDDLSLEPSSTPPLTSGKAISAQTWAALSGVAGRTADSQPWRQYWPPALNSPWFWQVASQRPDVLYFSFDPHNHLLHQKHPWQMWKSQHAALSQPDDEDMLSLSELSLALPAVVNESTQQLRDELDDMIQVDLQLPSVSPKQFNYLRPLRRYQHERPYRLQLPPGLVPIPATNVLPECYPVRIHDMSGHEDKFLLDVSGFQFFKCPVAVGEWTDQAAAETYLPALLEWVVALLGGDSGLVYSFNFRHHSSDRFAYVQRPWGTQHNLVPPGDTPPTPVIGGEDDLCHSLRRFIDSNKRDDPFNAIAAVEADPLGPCHWKQPLFRVHCDASENTHKYRLPLLLPDDADRLMRGRVRQVSVWRKLSTHVQDTPLAFCDARTVNPEDLVPMDVVYPHFADEVCEVRYSQSHRWFYNKSMTTEDVAIFKLHDTHSKDTVCPHSAFVDPDVPSGTPPRLSIEAKIMIFGG